MRETGVGPEAEMGTRGIRWPFLFPGESLQEA